MFTIKHRISNEIKKEISNLNSKSFDIEYGDIEGQFELNFNGNVQGFIHDDIPFGNELLVSWYKRLNEVALQIGFNNYVAFNILETDDYWIELIRKDRSLAVKKVKDNYLKRNVNELVITKPFEEFSYYDWDKTIIIKTEFIDEVKQKTKKFIEEVALINKEILDSKTLRELVLINRRI